jgi:hypothetical protein
MANKTLHLPIAGATRTDPWWLAPAVTFVCLSAFIVYATWRAVEGAHFEWRAYLLPFYSPFLDVRWARSWGLTFFTPAMLILPGPASFRLTCYYYRKAYYRAFAWDPPEADATVRQADSTCSRPTRGGY